MTAPNTDDSNISELAIFQSAVYGNNQLMLQQHSATNTPVTNIQETENNKARDTDYEDSDDDDDLPDTKQDIPSESESDNDNDTQNTNGLVRINWSEADDDFKQQFFRSLIRRYEEEHRTKDEEEHDPSAPFKVGAVVDLSLPHSKYPCEAHILEVLDNAEYRVQYTDPLDDIEKETIVCGDFLRGTECALTTESANKNEDEDAISNVFLEGVATYKEFEYLAVCIHPLVETYFFKPYVPKGFLKFLMMTESETAIDTVITTRDGLNEYDYISKFLSLNILSFIGERKRRKHKIGCIWCGVDDILMNKTRPRRRLLLGGVTYDRGVHVLCDNCGFTFHRDDVMFSCSADNHDVCIKCISQKIIGYQQIQNALSNVDYVQIYQLQMLPTEIINEITSFVCGKLLQFDK